MTFSNNPILYGLLSVSALIAVFIFIREVLPILRHPMLNFRAQVLDHAGYKTPITKATAIAAADLRASVILRYLENGEEKLALHAGYRNFREVWARDFGFAAYGLLALGEDKSVRETLEIFLTYQMESGQFPVKMRSLGVLNRFFFSLLRREQPIHIPIYPKYISGHKTMSPDGHLLILIAAFAYAQASEDFAFIVEHWERLEKALFWAEKMVGPQKPLLTQKAYADWADSVARQGEVLYTNVIYWKTLEEMAHAAHHLGNASSFKYYNSQADLLKQAIQKTFWDSQSGYFINTPDFHNLSSGGNLLAIAWGLASSEQSRSILSKMEALGMGNPVPTKAAMPPYPRRVIAIENRLGGIGNYHTEAAWLWLGAWHVIAYCIMNEQAKARELMERIANVIVRDKAVYEVYMPNGKFFSNIWYTSEAPLAWSAGMVVHAFDQIAEHQAGFEELARALRSLHLNEV